MRTNGMRAAAAPCLALALGLVGGSGAIAQDGGRQEPAGLPVFRGESPTMQSRPFSAEYQAAFLHSNAVKIADRAWAEQRAEWMAQRAALIEAEKAEAAAKKAAGIVEKTVQKTVVKRDRKLGYGTKSDNVRIVSTVTTPVSAPSVAMAPTEMIVMAEPAEGAIVASSEPVPAPVVVRKDGKLISAVPGAAMSMSAAPIMVGEAKILSSKVLSEKVYRINPDGSHTLIGSNNFADDVKLVPVPQEPMVAKAAPKMPTANLIPKAVAATEVPAKPEPIAKKKTFKSSSVPMLEPVMVPETKTAAKPEATATR